MPMPGQRFRWDQEDALADGKLGHSFQSPHQDEPTDAQFYNPNMTVQFETDKARSKPILIREPKPRSVLEYSVTPLLKRATTQDLAAARAIVKNALAQASKLNKARLASPLRNKFKLKPGTVIGGGRTAGMDGTSSMNDINKDVPPLLTITDKIAAAAALVAEADAVGGSRNVTKRAAQADGTYWMQR